MTSPYFTGPFAPMCEMFVAQKRATGKIYDTQAKRLRQFDNLCKDYDVQNYEITKDIAQAWYVRRLNEKDSSRRDRVQVIQHFSEFLCKQGYSSYLFPVLPKRSEHHSPYIFNKSEIKKLFDRLDTLESTNFTTGYFVYPLLFRTLYGCGLRISEALSLRKKDVDIEQGVLHIWHGKNDKERLVPISSSLKECFRDYWDKAHSETSDDTPFFYTKTHSEYARSGISQNFKNYLWDIGITYRGKDLGPRVHDLRHTFVCHNIQALAEQGIPINSKLPILSKYLGHKSTMATQWYLRLTAETYPHIREICERELSGLYHGIPNFKLEVDDYE
ncbi:MAG: tyrosine-type recombinase/integrase [Clostridiaceae bacterium]|nr:tyrosine-type recombinase/integrase [Clostridiaceae bacterium]